MGEEQRSRNVGRGGVETSTAEWIVAAASALVVTTALGILLYEAIASPPVPPVVEVRVDSMLPTSYGYVVAFSAMNRGQQSASNVIVVGELIREGESVQASRVTLDYVPAEGERSGGLFFTEDPRGHDLTLRALGFDVP